MKLSEIKSKKISRYCPNYVYRTIASKSYSFYLYIYVYMKDIINVVTINIDEVVKFNISINNIMPIL